MDNEPEMIRKQMEETRASLTEKLETLEHQMVDTVQEATSAVSGTVASVKDAVAAVKESVHETVASVKQTFDLRRQVDQHPWAMVGGSVVVGYLAGNLLSRPEEHRNGTGARCQGSAAAGGTADRGREFGYRPVEEARTLAAAPAPARDHGWKDTLSDTFGQEIAQLKGLAIGAAMAVVRDLVQQSVSGDMGRKLAEVVNNITVKLGGEPIHDPILGPPARENLWVR